MIKKSISDLLDSDEDMAMMCLRAKSNDKVNIRHISNISSISGSRDNHQKLTVSSIAEEESRKELTAFPVPKKFTAPEISRAIQEKFKIRMKSSSTAKLNIGHKPLTTTKKDSESHEETAGLLLRQSSVNDKATSLATNGDDDGRHDLISIETLLENYLNEVEWIASEIDGCLDKITNSEENIILRIDVINNRILRFELFLSISSFIIGCGALVTGLFGMNLLSHIELNQYMFWAVTLGLAVGMLQMFRSFTSFGRSEKLF